MNQRQDIIQVVPLVPKEKLPEVRLWAAIIIRTLHEYEYWLFNAQQAWLEFHEPVHPHYAMNLREIRHELTHVWFGHICDNADIDVCAVMKRICRLEREYGFINIVFAPWAADELPPLKRYRFKKGVELRVV